MTLAAFDTAAHTAPEAIFPYKGNVQLLLSKMREGTGTIMGAAALIWHEQ